MLTGKFFAPPPERAFRWKGIVILCLMLGWFSLPLIVMADPEILFGMFEIGQKAGLATALSFVAVLLVAGLAWLALTVVGMVVAAIASNRGQVDNA